MYQYNLGIYFEKVAETYSEKIALMFSKRDRISYKKLNEKANQFARYLKHLGVRENDVVCISGDKKVLSFTCMLACLKIGAIYTLLDPESPAERLGKIFRICQPKILFVESGLGKSLKNICPDMAFTLIGNETDSEAENKIKEYENTNLQDTRKMTGENLAYIMFTSGSTGFPKGALMTHSNVLNFIEWSIETFGFTSDDILTNVNPLYFDNSVFDFYSSLFSGACLVPFSKETVTNPPLLVKLIDELGCTSWFSVPTLLIYLQTMKALNKSNLKSIKKFIFGGEGYPKAKLKNLYDIYSEQAEFFNVYGPTECTCMCSSYKITAEDFADLQGFPPLGKIADNFSYLILDADGNQVLENEIGELCLMGPNVGKGYYNDPEKTKEHFVQNPYNNKYLEMMYKTGDLVKYNRQDRKIWIAGRKDNQIKHMGYRIELEEIETAFSHLSYVSQAAVIHGNIRGLSQIIAIVSANTKTDETVIRNDLKQIIPHYMIPTKFHFELELPKNPNGKVDRRKLAEIYLSKN